MQLYPKEIRVGRQHNPRRMRWERESYQVCNITGSACLPKQSMSSCLDWPSGSLSTQLRENGTGFNSGIDAGGGAATGAAQACLPGTLMRVCACAEHAKRPEPMQQAQKHSPDTSINQEHSQQPLYTNISHSQLLSRGVMGCSGRDGAPLPLFLPLPLPLPSFIAVAGLNFRTGIPWGTRDCLI